MQSSSDLEEFAEFMEINQDIKEKVFLLLLFTTNYFINFILDFYIIYEE